MTGIDLEGKTAIVTGGYSGIGLETVRVFSAAGATVIAPARDREKAEKALAGIPGVEIASMDLSDPDSIDTFAAGFLKTGRPLHILVNNAGIMATPFHRDARGLESQFATNHLGHFQLTLKLKPALEKAGGARVIAVSSYGHRYSPVVFEDLNFEHRKYDRFSAYGQSKTANILFAVGLDERGRSKDIRAFAVHPGTIVDTDLKRHLSTDELAAMGVLRPGGGIVLDPSRQMKTIAQGAATTVWCAAHPQLKGMGGLYCENVGVSPVLPSGKQVTGAPDPDRTPGVMPYAIDAAQADKLWNLSESLTGLTF